MEIEIWKDVIGYEGLYKVSNLGRVKSLVRKKHIGYKLDFSPIYFNIKERIRKPQKNDKGRLNIVLIDLEGNTKVFYIHRLVAIAFIPNPLNKPEVNHKKGIVTDNRESELEWMTGKENVNHSFKYLVRKPVKGISHGMSKLNNEKVKDIRILRSQGKTLEFIANKYKVTIANIYEIVTYKTWEHVK
jgi:hypothetical protein